MAKRHEAKLDLKFVEACGVGAGGEWSTSMIANWIEEHANPLYMLLEKLT